MFAGSGRAAAEASLAFVAPAALAGGLAQRLELQRRLVAVADTRALGKAHLPENTALPEIRVEPDTFKVWIDGEEIVPKPVDELPLAQRYFLF
jgi:urease subunit alpha